MFLTRICCVCGRELVDGERKICLQCMSDAPEWRGSNVDLRAHRFPRTLPIEGVWPWLAYSNSDPICSLIRRGKFDDRPDIIEELARRYAGRLVADGRLDGIDAIVPVAMHWWKRMTRGYNQAALIADQISQVSGIPVVDALKASRHAVQSRKNAAEREANVAGKFALRAAHGLMPASHIAIVDDILTTGATLTAAMTALKAADPERFTVLTLAATTL